MRTKLHRYSSGPFTSFQNIFSAGLPLGFSYLVTFGIPPLLFVQVLYGQMFYSSSVLVGAFWIAVVPLLILAYAMVYSHKLTRRTRPRIQIWVLSIAALAMLSVGFIYVNNLTLSMTPERWGRIKQVFQSALSYSTQRRQTRPTILA